MATTFRADIADALVDMLEAQATATPTLLRKVHRSQPGGFGETPVAFLGGLPETVTFTSGTRLRNMTPEILLVDKFREATDATFDQLVDALTDRITALVHPVPGTVIEEPGFSTEDDELTMPTAQPGITVAYRVVRITINRITKREGRE